MKPITDEAIRRAIVSFVAYVRQHRRCQITIILVLFALLFLHPRIRQTLFGPRIDGIAWCVWDREIRESAHVIWHEESTFYSRLKTYLPWLFNQSGPDINSSSAWPVYVHLAEDGDVVVRRMALIRLDRYMPLRSAEIAPVCRRALEDKDSQCQAIATKLVWKSTKDEEAKRVALRLSDHALHAVRSHAITALAQMAPECPDLYDPMSKLADRHNYPVELQALESMKHFGSKGLCVVRKALKSPIPLGRIHAVRTAHAFGHDAKELIPDLLVLQDEEDDALREALNAALHAIDGKTYCRPLGRGW